MTRDQARAVLGNLDLLRHFAAGGEVVHRIPTQKGYKEYRSKSIILGNLHADGSIYYRMVKPRYKYDAEQGICLILK